jgi:hypothetical protein
LFVTDGEIAERVELDPLDWKARVCAKLRKLFDVLAETKNGAR